LCFKGLEDEVRGKQFSARHNLYLMGKNEETTEENGEIPSQKIKES